MPPLSPTLVLDDGLRRLLEEGESCWVSPGGIRLYRNDYDPVSHLAVEIPIEHDVAELREVFAAIGVGVRWFRVGGPEDDDLIDDGVRVRLMGFDE